VKFRAPSFNRIRKRPRCNSFGILRGIEVADASDGFSEIVDGPATDVPELALSFEKVISIE
jgi:hypothetical protein